MQRSLVMLVALGLLSTPAVSGTLSGTVQAKGMRSNADAVVYIEKIPGATFSPPEQAVVMDQKGKEFVPKVLPVLAGTTVAFLNSDPFNHNVFTPDECGGAFDLGTWPTGETRQRTFTEPCEAVMLCNVHPAMVAYILVLETPFFAVTDESGAFRIEGVPDGTYEVSTWHEELKKSTQSVVVQGDSQLDLVLER